MARKLRAVDPPDELGHIQSEGSMPLAGDTITHIEEYDDGEPPPPGNTDDPMDQLIGGLVIGFVTFILIMVVWRGISGIHVLLDIVYIVVAAFINYMSWGPANEARLKMKGK